MQGSSKTQIKIQTQEETVILQENLPSIENMTQYNVEEWNISDHEIMEELTAVCARQKTKIGDKTAIILLTGWWDSDEMRFILPCFSPAPPQDYKLKEKDRKGMQKGLE